MTRTRPDSRVRTVFEAPVRACVDGAIDSLWAGLTGYAPATPAFNHRFDPGAGCPAADRSLPNGSSPSAPQCPDRAMALVEEPCTIMSSTSRWRFVRTSSQFRDYFAADLL